MSVMISDMKPRSKKGWPAGKPAHIGTAGKQRLPSVFTVWDVNRDTATVFAACREHGEVTIRSRTGEQFVIRPTGSAGEARFGFRRSDREASEAPRAPAQARLCPAAAGAGGAVGADHCRRGMRAYADTNFFTEHLHTNEAPLGTRASLHLECWRRISVAPWFAC